MSASAPKGNCPGGSRSRQGFRARCKKGKGGFSRKPGFTTKSSEGGADGLRRRASEQFVLIGLVVDAVEIGAPDDLARVQEGDALLFGDGAIAGAEQARFLGRAVEHFRVAREASDRRRRDKQDFRRAPLGAFAISASEKDEATRALGDVEGGKGEALLQIVAAERENEKIDRRVAHKTGRQSVRARAIRLDRIVVNGGAAIEPFGDHLEIGPQLALQDSRPSLRAGKPAARRRIMAPGVGIAEGDDDRHRLKLPCVERHCEERSDEAIQGPRAPDDSWIGRVAPQPVERRASLDALCAPLAMTALINSESNLRPSKARSRSPPIPRRAAPG